MGWFKKKQLKVQPPYDKLSVVQQRALFFLLEYFSHFATDYSCSYIKTDAINYLEKAAWYFGLSKTEIDILRPHHQDVDELYNIIKGIKNMEVLDFMVNNCYNLVVLAEGDNCEPARQTFYSFWRNIGYSDDEIWHITQKYMYRTEI